MKDIGPWGERLQKTYFDMGVFDLGDSNLDLLMTQDEEIAEALDREHFAAEERERVAGWRRRSRRAGRRLRSRTGKG